MKTIDATMTTINAKMKDLKEVNRAIKSSLNGQPVVVNNAEHISGLAAGLKHGEIRVNGNTGNYFGALNDGATLIATKDTGNYVADNMTRGTVVVKGNAGYGAGQYCYGGTVIIYQNAGSFTATMNKGAAVIIVGNVGDEVGTYMLKGDLIVVGNAGENFANYLIRGCVYIGGKWKSLGNNTKVEPLNDADLAKLRGYFETYQIEADPATFKKIVAASEKPFYK